MLWALDETALDLFARRPARGFRTGLRFVDAAASSAASATDGFQPRQVVEVDGSSATPKLLVLLHVVAAFLLKSVDDAERAAKEDEKRATGAAVASRDGGNVENLLASANERVFLFDHEYEANANQLLQILDARLRTRILDPKMRQVHSYTVGDGLALTEQVFIFLKQFSRHHNPIIFAAKDTLANARNGWERAEYLPSSWTSQVSKRILLRTVSQPKSDESRGDDEAHSTPRFEARCMVRGQR
ncbi:hypothetical protein FI667_g4702, partial [Globisporangium splendens]